MTLQDVIGKELKDITSQDIVRLMETYDWELVDADEALNLHAKRQFASFLDWAKKAQLSYVAGAWLNARGGETTPDEIYGLFLQNHKS